MALEQERIAHRAKEFGVLPCSALMGLPYSWSVLAHTEKKLKTGYLSEKVELLGKKHLYLRLPLTAGRVVNVQDPAYRKGRKRQVEKVAFIAFAHTAESAI